MDVASGRFKPQFLEGLLISLVTALQSLLSVLKILGFFGVEYSAIFFRVGVSQSFSLGFDPTKAIILFSVIDLAYLLSLRRHREISFSLLAFAGLYSISGPEASVAFGSVVVLIMTLYSSQRFQGHLLCFSGLLIGLELAAIFHWVMLPMVGVTPAGWFADLEYYLFYAASISAPLIAILALFIWVLRPITKHFSKPVRSFLLSRFENRSKSEGELRLDPRVLLGISVILALTGTLYPFIPSVNRGSTRIGVDLHHYVKWMASVEEDPSYLLSSSRPIILLVIYVFKHASGAGYFEVVKYLPVLLNPLLALSAYFMVSQASGDRQWAGLSALFTVLGFKMTIGMYSHFLTNNLCLIFLFLALGLLFRDIRTERGVVPFSAIVMGSLAVFTHPWSIIQFYAPLALMALIMGYKHLKGESQTGFFTVITFLAAVGMVDVLKGALFGGYEGYMAAVSTAPSVLRLDNFWYNNVVNFRHLYSGFLSNSALIVLAGVGIYLLGSGDLYQFYLILLVALSSTYYMISHGVLPQDSPYNVNPSRIMYNLPLGVFMAMATICLIRNTALEKRVRAAFLVLITVHMAVYVFRSLANLFY